MLSDIAERCPALRVDCERDYKRLLSAVKDHGFRFLFETMPAFSKHFDQCLAKRRLTLSGLTHLGPFRSGRAVPRLFKGLLLRVFDEFGELRSEPDVQAIRFVRQLCSAAKRFRVACPDSSTWEQVNEFIRTDGEIVQASLNWDLGDFDVSGARHLQLGDDVRTKSEVLPLFNEGVSSTHSTIPERCILDTVQRTADVCIAQIGGFNAAKWRARHGPGAVADLRGDSYKYDFPSWSPKLEEVFPYADWAFANYQHWADTHSHVDGGSDLAMDHEPPARLLAVPKSFAGPRLIAAEPTSHQWCQQVVRDFLMSRIQDTCLSGSIDFSSQEKNGQLALEASKDGSCATIDLSSASDRLSCWAVERMFRNSPSLLSAFYAVRTRWITQDIDKKMPRTIRLRKFSTMGSALTFPVQTLVFAFVAIGVTLHSRGLPVTYKSIRSIGREVRVFGDDIIVPIDAADNVVEVLSYLGLKVNHNKTFLTGKFRESCGVEAYDGHDVTKVSVLSAPSVSGPESVLSALDTHNNFFMRGYYRTAEFIRRSVESLRRFTFFEVSPGSGSLGWYSFDVDNSHVSKRRWNEALHRTEFLTTAPRGGVDRKPVERNSMLLQYYTEVARRPISREERLGRTALRHPLKLRWMWAPAPMSWEGVKGYQRRMVL